jgi:uncharacterized protein (TIGR02145 family)
MRLIALLSLTILPFIHCFSQNTEVSNKTVKGIFVDSRDNKKYKTIKIGSQIWFAENFAYLPQIDTLNVSVYGYKGKSIRKAKALLSYKKFGALYSWEFAKKLAPTGWRLPTDADWQKLEKEIGIKKESVNTIGWRGTNNEVKKLKQEEKTGFNVVFGGWKSDYGEFNFQEQHANFWCADSYDNVRAFERLIGVKNEKIGREFGNKGCGFSVRYIKESDTKK